MSTVRAQDVVGKSAVSKGSAKHTFDADAAEESSAIDQDSALAELAEVEEGEIVDDDPQDPFTSTGTAVAAPAFCVTHWSLHPCSCLLHPSVVLLLLPKLEKKPDPFKKASPFVSKEGGFAGLSRKSSGGGRGEHSLWPLCLPRLDAELLRRLICFHLHSFFSVRRAFQRIESRGTASAP